LSYIERNLVFSKTERAIRTPEEQVIWIGKQGREIEIRKARSAKPSYDERSGLVTCQDFPNDQLFKFLKGLGYK
jgi:hypothetical protein